MVAVRLGTRVRTVIPSLPEMRWFRCLELAQVWGAMAIFSYRVQRCAAHLLAVLVVTEPERGVSHRDPAISAVRWSAAAGLRAGIGSGKAINADERVGIRP